MALIIMVYGRNGFFWVAWSAAGLQMTDTGGYRDDRQGGYREPPNLIEGGYKKKCRCVCYKHTGFRSQVVA